MKRDPILFIDCTSTVRSKLNTGVQRVVRHILEQAPNFERYLGVKCIPIVCQFNKFYTLQDAQAVTLESQSTFSEIDFLYSDLYFCPDAFWTMGMTSWYPFFTDRGVTIITMIYDLIPITFLGACSREDTQQFEVALLDAIKSSSLLPCISKETRRQLLAYCKDHNIALKHENCPVIPLAPTLQRQFTKGISRRLPSAPFFLVVGTIEPRRGYWEIIREYRKYRLDGGTAVLLIVGKVGANCQNILEEIHAFGPELIWLDDASDKELYFAYKAAISVICGSRAEGYGMPVAEGLAYNGLVLANRLPVFGEFAGSHPFYFDIDIDGDLASLMHKVEGNRQVAINIEFGTWEETARVLANYFAAVASFCGSQPAIEISRNSVEAVRWASWIYHQRTPSVNELEGWLRFSTVQDMREAMEFELGLLNRPLRPDSIRAAYSYILGKESCSLEEIAFWLGRCSSMGELRNHLLYQLNCKNTGEFGA